MTELEKLLQPFISQTQGQGKFLRLSVENGLIGGSIVGRKNNQDYLKVQIDGLAVSSSSGVQSLAAGTGISIGGTSAIPIITNTAPDQTVTLTAGSGITIGGSYPSFTITATGGGSGTVTSVSGLSPLFTVTNPTTTPTFAQISQSQNLVFASPNGSSGNPTFRALVAADIPSLNYVTSVAASISGALAVTGSPITSSGTLAFAWQGTSAQYVAGNGSLVTFPSLTGYVPYTGATADVDLGANDLNAEGIKITGVNGNGHLTMRWQATDPISAGNHTTFFANSVGDLKYKIDGNFYTTFVTSANTANRIYTLQNASGTLAFLTDIPSVTPSNVTAASSKITLAGTPTGAALQAFSIDVNEGNLTLNNIGGTLGISKGGTNLTALGTSLQYLRVNTGATALEYANFPTIPSVTPSALTKTDDTNVTLTLGGTPSTALLQATSLTLGWTGTLAASRLNANVVQSVVNDTNVTGSIATQTLTLGWTGTLGISRGGTGLGTLGTASQLLRVNAGATALEYFTPTYLTSAVTSIATAGLISGGTITSTGTITTSMATNRLVGRTTAGTGIMEEITVGTGLSLSAGSLTNSAPDQTVTLTGGLGIGTAGTYPNFTITNTSGMISITKASDGSAVTGTLANTLTDSLLIPAGTYTAGQVVTIMSRFAKTGTAGNLAIRAYLNTSNVLSGGTLIGLNLGIVAATTYSAFFRYFINIKTATGAGTEVISTASNQASDGSGTLAVGLSTITIDWTVDQYLILAVQNGSTADSTIAKGIKIFS